MAEEASRRHHRDLGNDHGHRDDERRPFKRRREGSRSPDREGKVRRRHEDRHDQHHGRNRRSKSPEPTAQKSKGEGGHRQDRRPVEEKKRRRDHTSSHRHVSHTQRPEIASNPNRGRDANRSRSSSSSRHHPHRPRRRSSTHSYHSFYSPGELPYSSRQLSKSDFEVFRPLFARYLDIQKNKRIGDMDEREARGRWKSFLGKWNDGTLAEGWYSPELFQETSRNGVGELGERSEEPLGREVPTPPLSARSVEGARTRESGVAVVFEESEDDGDDDGYGPVLPGSQSHAAVHNPDGSRVTKQGPGIPSVQDLEVRREMTEEERLERASQLRLERKADRVEQKSRLEELVPRADAGTRERKLEKKKEVNEKMKGFRERSPGAAEVDDTELLGGGDSVDELKRLKASGERKKTEREVRREEIQRAKAAEREERLQEYREKEEKAMVMFKELARQRYG
jgi:hypothetical protein